MRRRSFIAGTIAAAALPRAAAAQSVARSARIGWVTNQSESSLATYVAAFRAALAELGYVEGRNLTLEFGYGDNDLARVPELTRALVRRPVDVLITQGGATHEVRNLGLSVPVVYATSADPVSAGLTDSLARPRDNMTGVTFMAIELNGKRLELLREIIPDLSRVVVLGNPEHPGAHLEHAFSEETGRQLNMTIEYLPTTTRSDLMRTLTALAARPPQAISLLADGFSIEHRQTIIDFGTRHRAPVISGWSIFAHSGAICTFGPYLADSYRRLAYYVDRILRGAKPADLPIERPTKFELVANLRTARSLALTLPPALLLRADEVIE